MIGSREFDAITLNIEKKKTKLSVYCYNVKAL